jgi:hypothetical protein
VNDRPSASTPVTASGTACTIRVLRRFRNSFPGIMTFSDAISLVSCGKPPLESSIKISADLFRRGSRKAASGSHASFASGNQHGAGLPIFRTRPSARIRPDYQEPLKAKRRQSAKLSAHAAPIS